RAGAAEGQRAVQVPLDLVHGVQHPVGAVHSDGEVLPISALLRLRVEPGDPQGDVEGGDLLGTGLGGRGLVGDSSHQNVRSFGAWWVMTTGLVSRRMELPSELSSPSRVR